MSAVAPAALDVPPVPEVNRALPWALLRWTLGGHSAAPTGPSR
jgi:hypothetical protein